MARQIRETEQQLAARGIDHWGFPLPFKLTVPTPAEAPRRQLSKPQPAKAKRRQEGIGSYSPGLIPGLRRLCADQRTGECLTQAEIAKECGVNKDTIRILERQAIRRVRKILGGAYSRQLVEVIVKAENSRE